MRNPPLPFYDVQKNRIWTRQTSLIIILTLFLIFGHFEPNYSYEKYSNKKNGVFIHNNSQKNSKHPSF